MSIEIVARHAGEHDPAPRFHHRERLGDRVGRPDAVHHSVCSSRETCRRLERARPSPHGAGQFAVRHGDIGTELFGEALLMRVSRRR